MLKASAKTMQTTIHSRTPPRSNRFGRLRASRFGTADTSRMTMFSVPQRSAGGATPGGHCGTRPFR